ncbi:YcxB family protein [Enterovirga rhinocerotis]|nr:YcxB family protein [Enterovirga rhinocerotis]
MKRLLLPLLALVFLLAAVMYGVGGWPDGRQWASLLRRPDLVAMTLALLVVWANMHLISVAILTARFSSFAIAGKIVVLSFSEDGVDADVEGVASHVPWNRFAARIEQDDRVLLKIARWEALTVPRRSFPDDASWQDALALLRQRVPHEG